MLPTLQLLRQSLSAYPPGEARALIDLLLAEVAGISREQRFAHPETSLPYPIRRRLVNCARKVAAGHPVQYVLGYARFCGLRFDVTPSTLIPRPETEELVRWIVADHSDPVLRPDNRPLRILDIGTGSGCIAISLAQLIHNTQVVAIDLSTKALNIARRNAERIAPDKVCCIKGDALRLVHNNYARQLFSKLPPAVIDKLSTADGRFDIIVSNPPYICQKERAEMENLVLDHEPEMALFVPDDDPLRFYCAIAITALYQLRSGGALYFEINAAYGSEIVNMLQLMGYTAVELRHDGDNRPRMVKALRP